MGQKVPLASRTQLNGRERDEEERSRETETERIGGFMRGKQGREVPREKERKFYRAVKATDTNLQEV